MEMDKKSRQQIITPLISSTEGAPEYPLLLELDDLVPDVLEGPSHLRLLHVVQDNLRITIIIFKNNTQKSYELCSSGVQVSLKKTALNYG